MKVIDLLNKIANKEELPEIIKVKGATYYLCGNDNSGQCYFTEKEGFGGFPLKFNTSQMNDEVETIEEDKKIEKLEYNKVLHDGTEEADLPDEYYCEDCYIGIKGDDETNIRLKIINKINEIIDEINKMEEGK